MQKQKQYFIKKDVLLSSLSILGILSFVFITNPQSMPILFVLLLPLLFAAGAFVTTRLLLRVFFDVNDRQLKILSLSFAGGALLVVVLGSLKQLGIQDFVLALLLVAGSAFYFLKNLSQDSGA